MAQLAHQERRGMTRAEKAVSRGQALAEVTTYYHDLNSRAHRRSVVGEK
jgi:hypothetical protein